MQVNFIINKQNQKTHGQIDNGDFVNVPTKKLVVINLSRYKESRHQCLTCCL